MNDARLRPLAAELDAAEVENLRDEGPIRTRLHLAIVAICDAAGIANSWDRLVQAEHAPPPTPDRPTSVMETAVRIVVSLLVRHEYEAVVRITRGRRLAAEDLAGAIAGYGRRLIEPPADWWLTVALTEITASPGMFHVAAPLWTIEEGRSDLSLEMWLTPSKGVPGVYDVEVLDLHVL